MDVNYQARSAPRLTSNIHLKLQKPWICPTSASYLYWETSMDATSWFVGPTEHDP